MTDTNQTSPETAPFDAKRAIDFARSELFERTFKEGMGLVEETAAYLDGPGRAASKRLSRAAALAYAGESMRLTTRLMQVASWLLVQRAVRDGEIQLAEASSEKYRLISREPQPSSTFAGSDELPEALKTLIIRGGAIYERVRRLDETMYESSEETANPVSDQMARLSEAFSG
ncbi:MAG: protease adaptor protein RcdA [Caulobacteraceae bacterium]